MHQRVERRASKRSVPYSGIIYRRDDQTPDFLARVETERHRAKLARHGEDTH